jgi:hypothetical protein
MRLSISPELLRDLMDCIQAAKDSAPTNSLYAMQLDMLLEKTQLETGLALPTRNTDNGSESSFRTAGAEQNAMSTDPEKARAQVCAPGTHC